ncbi:MAG: hypothetical protein A2315_03965 [Ignavibacteria bacterium RIFOXYB2_FULL_35_12]|nr:MAG: hypothetical protein A2058_04770 [Ignavibacteria bacterium GWA2_36_19]OGU58395.1 MAG: hypothetical protein A2X60_05630 [Ignavibacteria bacterium GWF2_35_20]OGU86589.1 MAG: hypothetical protein A2492_01810 [Ignavibacteria bacterium RIFOXYC12_FULL_35_11]OGU89051.1 MAG: hypothetical protein A3K31_01545 [Ignavibacteria bacterium RIFOXYA12_FULL_35_25]OGU93321.1 MAG: hypothetical protein A2347_07190 [Ignavibacteria bacterium RIFOXYB12_FULL_35_14]OGV00086.1 MAG: hypothetical protein A2455_071
MTFIKLNIITIWGVLLIVPNLFSQTQQFEKFLIKSNKIFLHDFKNKIHDEFINNELHNKLTTITIQNLNSGDTIVVDHMMGTHANGNKSIHTYTYNQNVKRTSYLYETWDGSQLVPFWLCTYTYDLMGNRSIELQKRWEGNQWVNSLLKTFIYDSNGNMISELYETWDGSQWISAELYNYTYNFNGIMTSQFSQTWDGSQWVNKRRETYTFDFNGDRILEFVEIWESNQWVNYWRATTSYDSNGNRSSILSETWDGNQWIIFNRSTFAYDSNGNLTSGLNETFDGIQWANSTLYTYTYDPNDNLTSELLAVWYNYWMQQSRKTYVYNSDGKMVLGYSERNLSGNWEASDGWFEVHDSFGNISSAIASIITIFYSKLTDISDNEKVISDYSLAQNYPNPFNPSTTIKYEIPENSSVILKVYDVLGTEVITLVNQKQPVGNYEVTFNANELPSGVYLYRLHTELFSLTKKMLYLK